MARVEYKSTPGGWWYDRKGNAREGVTITHIGAAPFAAATGGTPYAGALVTNIDGELPGWLDPGGYTSLDARTGKSVTFTVPDADQITRLDSLEGSGPLADTTDATMDDAVSIAVPGRKLRRIPIADKAEYDLREFYSGSSQPADVLGHIQDGLRKTKVGGGTLVIPDSEEPWDLGAPLTTVHNARMRGFGPVRFNERSGYVHGTGFTNWPVLPNSLGESVLRIASGVNGPIMMNDYANANGERGPLRGDGVYVPLFSAYGLVFDHNGPGNPTADVAIDVRDAFSFHLSFCRLMRPRGAGIRYRNCNACDSEKLSAIGTRENVANGTGDIASSTTILNASGTWAKGDLIAGAGIPSEAYLTAVAGSTLTLSAAATQTATGRALTKPTYLATSLLLLEDTTTDCEHLGIDMHAAQNIVVIDSAYMCRVSGLAGYAIGGYDLHLKKTLASDTFDNRTDLRLDHATKHNARIDTGCRDNDIGVHTFSPGLFGTAPDADGGFVAVYCDGNHNTIHGSAVKGHGTAATMSAVLAYGPNAENNNGKGMSGGSDMTPLTRHTSYRPVSTFAPGKVFTNSGPEPEPFFISAKQFEAADGTAPAMANFNGTLHRVLAFADGATESAVAYITIPYGCNALAFRVDCVNLNPAVSGGARIQLGYADTPVVGGNTPGADETAQVATMTIGANSQNVATLFGPGGMTFAPVVSPGDPVSIRFKRLGADAADTLAAPLGLRGIRVEPLRIA